MTELAMELAGAVHKVWVDVFMEVMAAVRLQVAMLENLKWEVLDLLQLQT
jgi:hypothetical protein